MIFPNSIDGFRFWDKTKKLPSGCVVWTAGKDRDGYGKFSIKHRSYRAHRVAYAYFIKKNSTFMTSDLLVCHRCDNPSCVALNHLFEGTNHDNVKDMISKGRKKVIKRNESAQAKLSSEDVDLIIHLIKNKKILQKDLARLYGVSRALICLVADRKSWKHL
jgi:hypothetical protein